MKRLLANKKRMKKILSILICLVLGISSAWAGGTTTNSIKVEPAGAGVVSLTGVDYNGYTRKGNFLTGYYYTECRRETTGTIMTPTESTVSSYGENGDWKYPDKNTKVYRNAEADLEVISAATNYAFEKWTCASSFSISATFTNATALTTTVDYGTDSRGTNGTAIVTANFKKVIDPTQSVIDWIKTEEEDTYSTTVNLFKAGTLSVQSIQHVGGTKTIGVSFSKTTEDYANITLTAGADVVAGDQFIITLVDDNNGYATITVNILSTIKVTFVHPSIGKGSYTAVQTNVGGALSCQLSNTDADKVMEFESTNQAYHTLTATPHSDYTFYRWIITHADNSTTIKTKSTETHTFQDGDKITAEFLPKNIAQFVVKGVDGVYYHKLEDAITAAQSSSSKTVVVYTSGTLYNEHVALSADGKYEFTIPSGITLLVPGDAAYTVNKELREEDLSNNTTAKPTCYKYLTLSPNTRIIANGDICVYAKTSYVMGYDGKPSAYGKIDMKDQTEIVLNSGSQLTVFGYITGNPTTSRVLAKNGSKVYESFQFTDWPGGRNALSLIGNKQRVFPIKQFYIQSIETKLTLQSGAEEYVASAVHVSIVEGILEYKIPLNMIFIAKDTGSDSDKGFFCLNDGAELSKWYDGAKDRQVYQVNRMEGYSGVRDAKIGIMYTDQIPMADPLNSEEYVLAANNNMDISLYDVRVTSIHDFALMADSKLYIAPSSEFVSKGNLFVYDKEANDVGFYGAGASKLMPITYTAYHNADPGKRTADKVTDAQIIVDGKLIVQDGGAYGSGLFTTVENPLASDITYGAHITSNGGGLVDFQVLEKPDHYQMQGSTPITMPISYARLRNGDNSYSAGESMTEPSKYYYYKEEERWLNPKFGITNPTNNEFTVTLPQAKQQDVICKVTTEGMVSDISKSTFTVTLPATSRFTYGDDSHTYTATAEGGELMIPLTYNPVNVDNTGAPYTETMTISYTYYDVIEGQNVTRSTNVTLTANENYTPDFTVTIGSKDVTIDKQYTFAQTVALNALPANVVITPVTNTVATLPNTTWQGVATSSPTFTTNGTAPNSLEVVYTPQTAGDHTGTLTITATYTDDASKQIKKDIVINLNGTGRLQDNTLAFQQDLIDGYTIDQGLTYQNIFANLGNETNITFTCTYVGGEVDGQDASALVVVSPASDNYIIKANEVASITEARTVKVVATQAANSFMNTGTREVILNVVPPAIWNWSDLYFGQTYTQPVTPSRADAWTLTEITDPNNMVGTLQGDYTNYYATIATGDPNTIYEATFKFVQGQNEKVFTSKIYADPRVVGFCVDAAHKYKGVTKSVAGGVSFDENNDQVSLKAGAVWEIQMSGTPDEMTFTTNGENLWNIEQRATESAAWQPIATWTQLTNDTHSFTLLPTTSFVRISYGAANPESVGQVSDFCVSKLTVKADVSELYMPINKDGSNSVKTVVLTHTESTAPALSPITGLDYNTVTTGNLGTSEEPYYQTTLTITTPSTFARGAYTLTASQGGESAVVAIYADYFPQGLPVNFAVDDTKRYHFLLTEADHVRWNETSRQVVLQNPGANLPRTFTFTFEGAPNVISFDASQDIVDANWTIYESADGVSFTESSLANRDSLSGTKLTHKLQYTTRYVRVKYQSDATNEIYLSNLTIKGEPMLLVDPVELVFSDEEKQQTLTLTTINLNNIKLVLDNVVDFQMSHGAIDPAAQYTLSSTDYPGALGINKVGDIVLDTKWIGTNIVNDGMITVYNTDNDSILAKVKLIGANNYIKLANANNTGLYTGIPNGTKDANGDDEISEEEAAYSYTFHTAIDYQYQPVDLTNAFATDGTALFDYLIVYGETTTTDATKSITAPSGEKGSNALTPYYVYARDVDNEGKYDRYRFVTLVENANHGSKTQIDGFTTQEDGKTIYVDVDADESKSVYMTGFCPYATTGYTSDQEGAWFFRGRHGAKLDVYLENCYIFSRNKMENGQPFYARGDKRNPVFTEDYARGSGGVLVFECVDESADVLLAQPFDVTIHTMGKNLLKSNYGSFCSFFGMDPFQISAPIHVRMHSKEHVRKSKTSLTFDDKWPTAMNSTTGEITNTERTNGFLSLQKLNNNAPSIDLGNPNTIVNFMGGQVELQNAQIVSTNYKTTLAISYRSGEYGGDNVGLKFATGIGTDSVGGEVNFYDGTITVLPMWVKEEYKQYYLIDKDINGNEITQVNPSTGKTEYLTTCLRCPKNTEVYGGSVCWLRACQHVTSKGGAPTFAGKYLGQYIYDIKAGDVVDPNTGLATQISFPEGIVNDKDETLSAFYNTYHPNGEYGLESVSPSEDKLYFWIPEGFGGISAEKDKLISTWKACMTRIEAGYQGKSGGVGGDTPVEPNEEIKYLLYCKIDENMLEVISAGEGEGEERTYTYSAPVKVPNVGQGLLGEYTTINPTHVGMAVEHQIMSDVPYTVTDKVYYVTTATADIWQSFTAPFDVEKIWVVETYDEKTLKKTPKKTDAEGQELTKHKSIMLEQAKHNADFAAFFGVAMAIGSTDPFETIFDDWKKWGMLQDKATLVNGNPLYSGELSGYNLRGRAELVPYIGNNWETAHFYLNHNKGNWELDARADTFMVQWDMLTQADLEDGILLHQGETYSMLFPYCTGCWTDDGERPSDFWDYWSGKILIFESTKPKTDEVHTIQGSNFIATSKVEEQPWIFDEVTSGTDARLSGNSTFAMMNTSRDDIYTYTADPTSEGFWLYDAVESGVAEISPSTSFLYANVPANQYGMPAKKVTREGKIVYGEGNNGSNPQGPTTGTHTPTVGGGNDMFITAVDGGINIAVAAPQMVCVVNATGHIIYSGYVADNVDVLLPMNGIYVVKGENEAQKIFF